MRIFLFLLFVIAGTLPAMAAEVTLPAPTPASGMKVTTPSASPVPTATTPQAHVPSVPATTPPSLMPSPSTPVSDQQANAFYAQCRDNPTGLQQLTPPQREYLCRCLGAGLKAEMNVEDVRQMRDRATPVGRAALVKMMGKVYFPCTLKPIEDSVRAECERRAAANPTFASGGQQYCGCLANKMVSYVQKVGVPETLYRLISTGEMMEPFDALTSSSGYSQELLRGYYDCFGGVLP